MDLEEELLEMVEEAHLRAAVRLAVEQADRGELIEHSDVKARIERLLQA
jgi:hypothetical protein